MKPTQMAIPPNGLAADHRSAEFLDGEGR